MIFGSHMEAKIVCSITPGWQLLIFDSNKWGELIMPPNLLNIPKPYPSFALNLSACIIKSLMKVTNYSHTT
jgi:hypothetical protein